MSSKPSGKAVLGKYRSEVLTVLKRSKVRRKKTKGLYSPRMVPTSLVNKQFITRLKMFEESQDHELERKLKFNSQNSV